MSSSMQDWSKVKVKDLLPKKLPSFIQRDPLATPAMAPKRKAIPEDASAQASPPKSTKKSKAEKKREVPETDANGWVLQWPNLLLSK